MSDVFGVDAVGNRHDYLPSELRALGFPTTLFNGPALTITPASLSFGTQDLTTQSPPQLVTVKNSSIVLADISSVTIGGTNPSDFINSDGCGTVLAAGASCTASISFQPTVRGARNATLNVVGDVGSIPQVVALSGTGDALSVSAASLNFSGVAVGSSAQQTVTLTNLGNKSVSLGAISLSGKNKNDYAQSNTCGSSLGSKNTCTITVTFTPGFKNSTRTASLNIPNSGTGTNSVQQVSLTGMGR